MDIKVLQNIIDSVITQSMRDYANTPHSDKNRLRQLRQKDVLDALKGKGNWQTYKDEKTGESVEFRMTTNKYVPIIKYTSNAPKKMVIDTKLDGVSSKEFKRGRFSESRVRTTDKQKKERASRADKNDQEELQLVYNEYMALKELIGSM